MENSTCSSFLKSHDIVFLSEIKCTYPFSLQGFHCIRSTVIVGEENRGGVAVLFKNDIWKHAYDIKYLKDQIWFKLDTFKNCQFGAIYIAPRDSPYFAQNSFAHIHEMACDDNEKIFLLGDFNARIKNLNMFDSAAHGISFSQNVDNGVNTNGKDLTDLLLTCNMKPLNHMNYNGRQFEGKFTFKQGRTWISQLDWCIVSSAALDLASNFEVMDSVALPTNHAPIVVTINCPTLPSVDELLQRASQLGCSVCPSQRSCRRPIKFCDVDRIKFAENIPPLDYLWYSGLDLDTLCDTFTGYLYQAALDSIKTEDSNTPLLPTRSSHERWSRILHSHDSKQLWNSINWNGSFDTPTDILQQPSEDTFGVIIRIFWAQIVLSLWISNHSTSSMCQF